MDDQKKYQHQLEERYTQHREKDKSRQTTKNLLSPGWIRTNYDFGIPYATLYVNLRSELAMQLLQGIEVVSERIHSVEVNPHCRLTGIDVVANYLQCVIEQERPDLRGVNVVALEISPWMNRIQIQVLHPSLPRVSPATYQKQKLQPCPACKKPFPMEQGLDSTIYYRSIPSTPVSLGRSEEVCSLECSQHPGTKPASKKPDEGGWGKNALMVNPELINWWSTVNVPTPELKLHAKKIDPPSPHKSKVQQYDPKTGLATADPADAIEAFIEKVAREETMKAHSNAGGVREPNEVKEGLRPSVMEKKQEASGEQEGEQKEVEEFAKETNYSIVEESWRDRSPLL